MPISKTSLIPLGGEELVKEEVVYLEKNDRPSSWTGSNVPEKGCLSSLIEDCSFFVLEWVVSIE